MGERHLLIQTWLAWCRDALPELSGSAEDIASSFHRTARSGRPARVLAKSQFSVVVAGKRHEMPGLAVSSGQR
jgi:hypothetical protein